MLTERNRWKPGGEAKVTLPSAPPGSRGATGRVHCASCTRDRMTMGQEGSGTRFSWVLTVVLGAEVVHRGPLSQRRDVG